MHESIKAYANRFLPICGDTNQHVEAWHPFNITWFDPKKREVHGVTPDGTTLKYRPGTSTM